MQAGEPGGSLWVDGEFLIRVQGNSPDSRRILRVRRPYALAGSAPGADILLERPAVSARHLYLHLDRRGVFVVDLVSRTGMRLQGESITAAWLRPLEAVEVGGHQIEIVEARIDGQPIELAEAEVEDDPLGGPVGPEFPRVLLTPKSGQGPPWVLSSELVFLGRSAACAVKVEGTSAARAHCVLVRSPRGAFLVNLIGRLAWLNHRPVFGAARVQDGDVLTIGSTEFTVQVEPEVTDPSPETSRDLTQWLPPALPATMASMAMPLPAEIVPPEAQNAFLAWMFGMFQAGQGEMLRRQDEFQLAMTEALRQMQSEHSALLSAQLDRMNAIQRELAKLRAEVQRIETQRPKPAKAAVEPPRPAPIRLPPRPEPPLVPEGSTAASTTWLLSRISQLEEESRSTWKDFLGRLNPNARRPD